MLKSNCLLDLGSFEFFKTVDIVVVGWLDNSLHVSF